MSRQPSHDYDLLRRILREDPTLEKSLVRLAAEYTRQHPDRARMPVATLRYILRTHGKEILGRAYRPAPPGRPVKHDHNAIRLMVREDSTLLNDATRAAEEYAKLTGLPMSVKHMRSLLTEWRENQVDEASQEPRSSKDAAVDRFGEALRVYRSKAPREHDVLHGDTWAAYYADFLADAIHWALAAGISVEPAMCAAWETVELESAK